MGQDDSTSSHAQTGPLLANPAAAAPQSTSAESAAMVVVACDDEILPSQARIETVGDTGDLEDVYNSERSLLYVACTRARDHLLVTAVEPESEFLDDLLGTGRPR